MSKRADQRADARVAAVSAQGATTRLTLAGGGTCTLASIPDPASARRLRTGIHHLGSVRIDVAGERPRASVVGSARHLPVRRSVPVSTALALAAQGVPTLVRRPVRSAPMGALR